MSPNLKAFLRLSELPYFNITEDLEKIKLNSEVAISNPRIYCPFLEIVRIVIYENLKFRDLKVQDWIVVNNIEGRIIMYVKTNKFYEVELNDIIDEYWERK